jgi:intraflagellar transport protein 46
LSVNESFDARQHQQQHHRREEKLANDKYDEAVEVSQSMDVSPQKMSRKPLESGDKNSASITNKPFDEALEFSQSGSDESVDTRASEKMGRRGGGGGGGGQDKQMASLEVKAPPPTQGSFKIDTTTGQATRMSDDGPAMTRQHTNGMDGDEDEESSSEEEDEEEEGEDNDEAGESYDNIEGAYNARDYQHLNVSLEVKDLFQYIDRYKPHEVELDTHLKCFIPEYIPAIGEIDGFIKVPRPDGEDDGLGLKILDEPATIQSDPTVLELQLRATSKKQQYGDVVVRSIENAEKSPAAIEKWIQSITDLHRSKPPPQVHYKKNMPDAEVLMDQWPEGFEEALKTLELPSPELDVSLAEYAKVLCSVLDIPTYENPVESLHLMFSLYVDFRDNPHFQAMRGGPGGGAGGDNGGNNYGGADVLEINQEYK